MTTIAIQGLKGLLTGIRLTELFGQLTLQGLKPDETQEKMLAASVNLRATAKEERLVSFFEDFQQIFVTTSLMPEQIKIFNQLMSSYSELSEYKEYIFDLFFVNALALLGDKAEDYMESPAWEKIEQQTADRGTEALNVFMYLEEVKESDIRATLDDFLEGFVLDEELDYQEDAEVYEEVMANRAWLDLPYAQMIAKTEALEEETAMPALFTPLFCFFKSPEKSAINLMACLQSGGKTERNTAVSAMLQFFYHGEDCIDQRFTAFLD